LNKLHSEIKKEIEVDNTLIDITRPIHEKRGKTKNNSHVTGGKK
jgi:hypothetical protein